MRRIYASSYLVRSSCLPNFNVSTCETCFQQSRGHRVLSDSSYSVYARGDIKNLKVEGKIMLNSMLNRSMLLLLLLLLLICCPYNLSCRFWITTECIQPLPRTFAVHVWLNVGFFSRVKIFGQKNTKFGYQNSRQKSQYFSVLWFSQPKIFLTSILANV